MIDSSWGWWTGSFGVEIFGSAMVVFEICGECQGFDCRLKDASFGGVFVQVGLRACMGAGCFEQIFYKNRFGGLGS